MDLPKEKRVELSNELYNMVSGKAKSVSIFDWMKSLMQMNYYGLLIAMWLLGVQESHSHLSLTVSC